MVKIIRPRKASTVCIKSVCCSIEFEEARQKYDISASEAYKRGLKFFIDNAEGKDADDSARIKIEKLTKLVDHQSIVIEEMQKELDIYRRVK